MSTTFSPTAAAEGAAPPALAWPVVSRDRAAFTVRRSWFGLAMLLAAHGALGLAMYKLPGFALLHEMATVLTALAVAVTARRIGTILMAMSYVVGAEVLWRVCGTPLFHELAKYVVCAVCLITIFRIRGGARIPAAPLLYFGLLIPGLVTPFFLFSLDTFRKQAMFNLSGPMSLMCVALLCANLKVSEATLMRLPLAMAGPLFSVAAITFFTTYTARSIRFSTDSNYETSGGFGPNQVASSLGLGLLVLLLYLLTQRGGLSRHLLLLGTAALFGIQSAMTFSRNGVILAGLGLLAALPLVLVSRKTRTSFAGIALLLLLASVAVVPVLNRFTGGRLAKRYSSLESTGRSELAARDLRSWADSPVFGVGIGVGTLRRGLAAHTEATRALSEHGSLGLVSLCVLAYMCAGSVLRLLRQDGPHRAFLLGLLVWGLGYLLVNGMRTVAPGFAIGLMMLGPAWRQEETSL